MWFFLRLVRVRKNLDSFDKKLVNLAPEEGRERPVSKKEKSHFFVTVSLLFFDLVRHELSLYEDERSGSELVISFPGRDEFPVSVDNIALQQFCVNETEQRAAKVRKESRVVERANRDVWRCH